MAFDRSRVMRTAHAEYRATRHRRGVTFGTCLKLAWAVEKRRAAGREYYNPEPKCCGAYHGTRDRDILLVASDKAGKPFGNKWWARQGLNL